MRLSAVLVRFYRSFNYDFERKWRATTGAEQWEDKSEGWFPFVEILIDPEITAVIGSNEAGKTQMLNAAESAVTGEGISPADFCRYSHFYSVQRGEERAPEFGAQWTPETNSDLELVKRHIPSFGEGDSFLVIRPGLEPAFVVFRGARIAVDVDALSAELPKIFKLKTDLRMPDTMSILALAGTPRKKLGQRRRRRELMALVEADDGVSPDKAATGFPPLWQRWAGEEVSESELRRQDEFELGRKLLIDIAKISPSSFQRLQTAIDEEHEGEIEGIIGAMNTAIDEHLNFRRWWTQDSNFDIQVKAREQELALVIRDRTKSSYSFAERSQGLQYFLSYFVQLEAHKPEAGRDEIMLLDEADAFLSSRGQQDLLRVIQEYARPEAGSIERQVVYVTHSPFLIDRNAGQRIRVLDKGKEDEGTRVVRDATQNHYEPLRTSLGVSTAETAFIGGRNLFVEGIADQVLLTGMVADLARQGDPTLDLNEVTVVPGNGADSIPYMVFLARGRGGTLPPAVALFDGDEQGQGGARALIALKSGKRHVLAKKFVVLVNEWAETQDAVVVEPGVTIEEPEDLIPLSLAVAAAQQVALTFGDGSATGELDEATIAKQVKAKHSLWPALAAAYKSVHGGTLDKVAFSRELLSVLSTDTTEAAVVLRRNFYGLLRHIADLLDDANAEETSRRGANRLDRSIGTFLQDHQDGVTRRRARSFIRELEQTLDESAEADHIRIDLNEILRVNNLDYSLTGPLHDFDAFRDALARIKWIREPERNVSPDVSRRTAAPVATTPADPTGEVDELPA